MMVKEHFIEDVRPGRAHDRLGRLGRRDPAVRHRRRVPGHPRRHRAGRLLPGPVHDRSDRSPTAGCWTTTSAAGGTASPPRSSVRDRRLHVYDTCRSRGTRRSPTGSPRPTAATRRSRSTLRWDPVTNPDGVKCSATEQYVNQLGRDPRPASRAARWTTSACSTASPRCRHGQITAAQFADLNAGIGGFDYTGKPQAARSVADPRRSRRRTATTWSTAAARALRETAVIDQRIDLDLAGSATTSTPPSGPT